METLTLCSLKVISGRGDGEGFFQGRTQLFCRNGSLRPGNILVLQSLVFLRWSFSALQSGHR